ncbi:EamA family transporter [Caenimonas koreensis DSM 17982]|uniref:EamA family transporter n=1 Tax=Caenimonas koreensis DSM 17982 TaxID=1121255 RepID=A0A844B8G6_9BURK|nr:EamA family transporter [Caenimonas koreensis]MRD49443.1 EamA family transporter [Caenimonas koreensis DSM 17982]
MPITHLFLALAVVFVWGTNFVVIHWGLAEFPPFVFATLRFTLSTLPWVFFIPRPAVGWRTLAQFGVLLGAGQFGLLYLAMRSEISPGLASLLMQSQVFFTIGAAVVFQGERMKALQVPATLMAVAGVALIGWHGIAGGGGSITALGLVLVLCASASWAGANIVARSAGRINALSFMVWSSPFAVPPLALLALAFDGWPAIAQSIPQASLAGWSTVLWQAIGNTLFGYGVWNWLLARHPASTITPTALLVPVFGMTASAWVLGESLDAWKVGAAALVMGGLVLNLLASRP